MFVAHARRGHLDVDRLRRCQWASHVHGRHGATTWLEVCRRRYGASVLNVHGLWRHRSIALVARRRGRWHRTSRVLHLRRNPPMLHRRGLRLPRCSPGLALIPVIARVLPA